MTLLADLTWPQVVERSAAVLAVPVGSTEQHGPHLPLSTDTDVAVALAARLAAVRADVVVAPAVPYGASGEHAGFAGTLSIGHEALELLLVELVRSATQSFDHVLLVSGHGGNAATLGRVSTRCRAEGRDVLVWAPRWGGDAHAGRTETSVQLSLDASRVGPSREAGASAPLATLLPVLRTSGVLAVSPNGVLGDPTGASGREGSALLTAAARDLQTAVAQWLAP